MPLTWTPQKIERTDWPWVAAYTTQFEGKTYHLYYFVPKSRKSIKLHLDHVNPNLVSGYIRYGVKRHNAEILYRSATCAEGGRWWEESALIANLETKSVSKGVTECLLPEEKDYRFCTESQKLLREKFESIAQAWAEQFLVSLPDRTDRPEQLLAMLADDTVPFYTLTRAAETAGDLDKSYHSTVKQELVRLLKHHKHPVVREGAVYGLHKLMRGDVEIYKLLKEHEDTSSGVQNAIWGLWHQHSYLRRSRIGQ